MCACVCDCVFSSANQSCTKSDCVVAIYQTPFALQCLFGENWHRRYHAAKMVNNPQQRAVSFIRELDSPITFTYSKYIIDGWVSGTCVIRFLTCYSN